MWVAGGTRDPCQETGGDDSGTDFGWYFVLISIALGFCLWVAAIFVRRRKTLLNRRDRIARNKTQVVLSATFSMDFHGFTTACDTVITSSDVVTANNLVVGQAVSAVLEPGTMAGAGFLACRRRNG